ncbi:hypothetical protein ACKE5C_02115 [Aneurinibacillus thermoaerophilus]|uniref:Uncharacterized protein n=1 Tax=Aneurinibacillus thermoaerophilus TaxID=143495 RepID=A0ABX8YBQ1_ANETH|nr:MULTISPECIES: hypothetical protein [Aneurinibacillus]AMA74292.1 hypothetical protein ACH33_16745 [Aneurinibacillus sp. XH2]QYY43126.1 hypothetical protein K3F53_02095 [Aneurinibacillus thermoaerophilus]
MFGSLKNIYDMYRLGKSVVNSKSFQKSLNRAEKEYQKRRKKQEEKLKRTKAGRRQLKEIKAYEKATKQLWKGFTQSFQTLGKVCTSARKLATNLLPIEQIYKLKKIMKAEVIKKQNSAIKKLQKPKSIQKPKSVSPSPPPKRSMMDDLVVGLKKFGREFKPAFSHGAKELATLSNYKPLTRELVGKENFDALTDNKWTMDDVKAAGGALENLFLGRLKVVKNINKTVKITKRLDKAKQPLQPPKPKQSTGNATKGTGKLSTRDTLLNAVSNQKLKNAIDQMYRPGATIGDGGLADAIRHELSTGQLVGGKSHIQKGIERVRNLENIIKKENLNPNDLATAQKLLDDLKDALQIK